ncbi:MAG: hypothetical protein Kow0068_05860 [Marinilabiliales bacterium]
MVFTACKKEEEQDTETTSAIDYTKAQQADYATFSTVNHYGINQEEIKSFNGLKDTISITVENVGTTEWPKRLILDFGTGTLCSDNKTRSGKLIAEFSNHWHPDSVQPGTSVTVTFDNYKVDNTERQGTIVITYDGKPNGGAQYTIKAQNAKLIFSNGDEISWNSTRTIEWISGYDTYLDNTDDVFEVTGNASGINRKGRSYTAEITTPILVDRTCEYEVVQGVIEITPAEKATRKINYGDGTCDNQATLSVGGVSVNFNF